MTPHTSAESTGPREDLFHCAWRGAGFVDEVGAGGGCEESALLAYVGRVTVGFTERKRTREAQRGFARAASMVRPR